LQETGHAWWLKLTCLLLAYSNIAFTDNISLSPAIVADADAISLSPKKLALPEPHYLKVCKTN
jgi:hypothetical protein